MCIPSYERSSSLEACLKSIRAQTFQNFEILINKEEGPLAKLRNKLAQDAKGEYLVFIDDDVICSPGWLAAIVKTFEDRPGCAGVSGPAFINQEFRRNRDIFSYKFFKSLYDFWFCGKRRNLPGHITVSGAWTTGACDKTCSYEGEVDFLEACNMAYRADIFRKFGGFDESYQGVGDWSEPDLAFWIKRAGYELWFARDAGLEHRPSQSGAFKKRKKQSVIRLENYERFSRRWITPCWQHELYKLFLKIYYALASH
mgnify:CR=1 FL=1